MLQERYPEAVAAWDKARRAFEDLGEPGTVAIAWHQLAMVHRRARQLDAAERAYLRSLEIQTRLGNRSGQGTVLLELGILYGALDRSEESADHHRRAADIYDAVGDVRGEGLARNNLALVLHRLSRPIDARAEALRAIELKRPFGHAAEPWTTWAILADIEHDLGDPDAAATARQHAIEAYAAYRRDGGFPRQWTGRLVEQALAAITEGAAPEAIAPQLATPDDAGANIAAFFSAFRAILAGGRDPALATDPALDYDDAAELTLLLDRLAAPELP